MGWGMCRTWSWGCVEETGCWELMSLKRLNDDSERAIGQRELEEHCPGGIRRKLKAKPILKQVEMNTIATAGVSHSNIVSDMHHHLLRTGIYDALSYSASTKSDTQNPPTDASSESTALPSLPPTRL